MISDTTARYKEIGVFAGSGSLGAACLKRLLETEKTIDFVLTHKSEDEFSVQNICKVSKIRYSFADLRKGIIPELDRIESIQQKLLISINYRYILPSNFTSLFKYPLNIHGSLLPKYRGRTPHVWAIINGEKETGITCHIMNATVDTGDIVHQIPVNIDLLDTGGTLLNKFERLYPDCLERSLDKISKGISMMPQDESQATYFGKRIPEMGYIDFTKDRCSAINFIRAQSKPYPGAYCFLATGKKMIVHQARILENEAIIENMPLGAIRSKKTTYVAQFKDGGLEFTDFEIV